MAGAPPSCATCKKTPSEAENLKRCAKCQTTWYCSRECQKQDWKVHKKVCSKQAGDPNRPNVEHNKSSRMPKVKNLDVQINKSFAALDNGTFLHGRSELDVYKLLIDCFRMRQEDDYKIDGDVDKDSIYASNESSIVPFRRFMRKAASREGILPPWWDATKQDECEKYGMNIDNWSNLKTGVEKSDITKRYGNEKMPMQLRMLGEAIYGRGPGGQDGTQMRRMMMEMENGGGGNLMSMLSLNG